MNPPTIRGLAPLAALSLLALAPASLQAATLTVLPGTSIQAKINLAQAGDIVAIFGGIYNEDLTINKAIRLVEVSGQQVTLAGSLTFSGIANAPPFDGFTAGSAGRGISIDNCTGLVFRNLSAQAGSGISVTGNSSLDVTDSTLSNLTCSSGTLRAWKCQAVNITAGGLSGEVWDCTLSGAFNHSAGKLTITKCTIAGNFDTQPSAQQTIAFRTAVAGDCTWGSKKAWFGYGKAQSLNFYSSDSKLIVVGNDFNRNAGRAFGIQIQGSSNKTLISNNSIYNINQHHTIAITGNSNKTTIANNYLATFHGGSGYIDYTVMIYNSNITKVIGNIFGSQHSYWNVCIHAPFGSEVEYNLYANPWVPFSSNGGVSPLNNLNTNPLFVENEAPKLQPTSPCLNAGTPDPRYNNRDGTRNTIGPSGGAWFDPEGWTTPNPVVVSFDVSPDQVLEGVDTEVIVSDGLAVSAPQ